MRYDPTSNAAPDPLKESLGDWPATGLKSTTEVLRHEGRLRRLFEQAMSDGIQKGVMIEIGPGAAVAFLAGGLTRPAEKSGWAELSFQAFRFSESVLRHVPGMPLRSLEPAEILDLAHARENSGVLGQLVVVDRDSRVLRAAQEALSPADGILTRFVQYDINGSETWTVAPANMLCAFKCSHLLDTPGRLFDNASSMLALGGLFSTTDVVSHPSFEPLDPQLGLYRKVA